MEHKIPNALLILLHLHLLNYPIQDATGYDEHLFSPTRGMRERNKAMEDICYFLVGKIERSKDRARSILPSYPCLQPSDATAFRIALAKYMEGIRNSITHTTHAVDKPSDSSSRGQPASQSENDPPAWWWRDVVVRKSVLDECAGERFERLILAFSSHAVHKNVTRTPSALQSQSLSAESPVVISDTLATAYTARLAAAQSERLEWERSAALLVQRQADLAMIRARLADPRHASSSKYDSLDTARLLALRDSRLQDLLRGSWRDDEGRRALQLVTSLAGLVDTANSSASPPGARVDEIGMQSSSTCKESQVPTALDAALSLPIAAARHPSHLHGLRAPLFPKAKPSPASNEDGAQAPRLSYAVEERFAAIEDVHRSLQEALAATQAIHARLDQRLRKAKGRQPTSAPARTSKARPLKLDGSLWAQRTGDGVSFKSPEDAASLLSQYDLQMPLSESSIEARIAQIRTTMLPPFTADPSPEPEAEPEPLPNLPASRLPQASSRTRTTKPASAQPGHRPSRPAIAGLYSSRVRIAEDSVQATRARDAAGQSKDEKARAASRRLSRRASAARARRSTMFGRGEDAEILRIVASVQDRSGSEDEDENDMVRDQGSHLPNGRLRTPMRTQRHLGTRGMLLSTAKKTAPRQSYDIDVHERARVPRLPSLRLSDAPELDEDEPGPQNVPDGGGEEAVYEGTSMTLADILMHAGHQGNASIQLLEEEMEDETSDWE
ncbi:hypothetical protein PYCCODRAFT_1223699 [Trametes coccinea BRFM310]|uniref:HAUS augmin-like complex subunit 6 N-terminal domain-containing protein n=1 Tax=Trametes coccinea (strain BRFM310) TaxID=1353009 RepID=A0A1Y2IW08_TRAC3|nr:hypothetical protein PYCCODRAFT_1223699 [Trametes coccinea BRFM310]